MGQLSAQDWLTLLYHIRGYLSSLPRLLVDVIRQDTARPPVQKALSLVGAGHPVDGSADLPLEGDLRQPVGREVPDTDGAIFMCDLFALFQVHTSISFKSC